MERDNEFLGWTKKVLSERSDGKHEWLEAYYYCRTLVEAVTLQDLRRPSHIRRNDEILVNRNSTVYVNERGEGFVVFDWRTHDPFIVILASDEY